MGLLKPSKIHQCLFAWKHLKFLMSSDLQPIICCLLNRIPDRRTEITEMLRSPTENANRYICFWNHLNLIPEKGDFNIMFIGWWDRRCFVKTTKWLGQISLTGHFLWWSFRCQSHGIVAIIRHSVVWHSHQANQIEVVIERAVTSPTYLDMDLREWSNIERQWLILVFLLFLFVIFWCSNFQIFDCTPQAGHTYYAW